MDFKFNGDEVLLGTGRPAGACRGLPGPARACRRSVRSCQHRRCEQETSLTLQPTHPRCHSPSPQLTCAAGHSGSPHHLAHILGGGSIMLTQASVEGTAAAVGTQQRRQCRSALPLGPRRASLLKYSRSEQWRQKLLHTPLRGRLKQASCVVRTDVWSNARYPDHIALHVLLRIPPACSSPNILTRLATFRSPSSTPLFIFPVPARLRPCQLFHYVKYAMSIGLGTI